MRVMILGAGGLIGHKLFQVLGEDMEVFAALHNSSEHSVFNGPSVFSNIDVLDFSKLTCLMLKNNIDVVLNCAGITKRKPEINDMELALRVNSLFPHQLANWASTHGKRIVHFSTDCVFDGTIGNYDENSPTSGIDTYGKTKALGEINYAHTLTIRSSFIGRELTGKTELLEWCLSQKGKRIKGFDKAFYSGVSTITMARVVKSILTEHRDLSGLVQLASDTPISKYELLEQMNKSFQLGITIERDSSFETMPTLDGAKLKKAIDLKLPSWASMMDELASDTSYRAETS